MRTVLFFLCLAAASPARAQYFSRTGRGTTTAEVLSLGSGARALAMGEAYTAISDDASGIFWNPGGLVQIPKASLSFMHASYVESIFYDNLSFVTRLSQKELVGGSIQYLDYGSIDGTDINNLDTSSFHPRDYVYTLTYARDLDFVAFGNEQFGFGVNLKYLRSTIVDTASSLNGDVGVLARHDTQDGRRIRYGFVLQNLGQGLKYDQVRDPIPTTFRGGMAFPITKYWLISADAVLPKGNGIYFAGGTEIAADFGPQLRAALRAGYNTLSDVPGTSNVSFGAGITMSLLSFDYAFLPMGDLGNTHRISVSLRFPGKTPAAEESIFEIQKKLLEP